MYNWFFAVLVLALAVIAKLIVDKLLPGKRADRKPEHSPCEKDETTEPALNLAPQEDPGQEDLPRPNFKF